LNPVLLWLTAMVIGAAIGLGSGFLPFLVVAALPVLVLVARPDAMRLGLSGLLVGFGGIWFLMISCVREQCAQGEVSGCYSSAENAWFGVAVGSLVAAAVLLGWATGSRLANEHRP